MGKPRLTTAGKLVAFDTGHLVRFTPTNEDPATSLGLEGVLLGIRPGHLGLFLSVQFPEEYRYVLPISDDGRYGPIKPWQPVEVLGRPGEARLGSDADASVASHLDPAALAMLVRLRDQQD